MATFLFGLIVGAHQQHQQQQQQQSSRPGFGNPGTVAGRGIIESGPSGTHAAQLFARSAGSTNGPGWSGGGVADFRERELSDDDDEDHDDEEDDNELEEESGVSADGGGGDDDEVSRAISHVLWYIRMVALMVLVET